MTSSYKFIVMHRTKLAWKRIRHGVRVLLSLSQREGRPSWPVPKRHDSDNMFIDYLIHHSV